MFAKVFEQIFDSSIADDYPLRQFFTDLLVLADVDGIVDMTPEAISGRTRMPLGLVLEHLQKLQQPDPRSRTKTKQGRRIILLDSHRDWGFRIINYKTYRDLHNEVDRKQYMRRYMRKYRTTNDKPVNNLVNKSLHVNTCKQPLAKLTHAEAEADAEADAEASKEHSPPAAHPEHKAFIDGWCQNFRASHGFDYVFNGGQDGKAVKSLLSIGILRIDLLEIAKDAWARHKADSKSWGCGKAVTISGFKQYLNEIRTELKNGNINNKTDTHSPRSSPQHTDRSVGTTNEGTASLYRGLGKVAQVSDQKRSTT